MCKLKSRVHIDPHHHHCREDKNKVQEENSPEELLRLPALFQVIQLWHDRHRREQCQQDVKPIKHIVL